MTNLATNVQSTTTDALNRVLTGLLLLPVESHLQLVGGSDAYIVLQRLLAVHREVQARGWYCFNRTDRNAPTYSVPDAAYTLADALSVRTATRMPADPCWPAVRALRQSGAANVVHLQRLDTGLKEFALHERNLLVDVVFGKSLDEAPEPYIAYVVKRALRELGPAFAMPTNANDELLAKDELQRYENDFEPAANVFEDEAGTLMTWARR